MSALTGEYQGDLTRLIEGPIRERRAALRAELGALAGTVKEGYENARRLNNLKREIAALDAQSTQKSTEREGFQRVAQSGLSENEKALFEAAEPLEMGRRAADEVEATLSSLEQDLSSHLDQVQDEFNEAFNNILTLQNLDVSKFSDEPGFNKDKYLASLEAARNEVIGGLTSIRDAIHRSVVDVDANRPAFNQQIERLSAKAQQITEKERHRKEAMSKADALGVEIAALQARRKDANREISAIEKLGLIKKGEDALEKYRKLVNEYSDQLIKRANAISEDESLRLHVRIKPGGQFIAVLEQLKEITYGAKVPGNTWEEMKLFLSEHDTPANVISEVIGTAINALQAGGAVNVPEVWDQCGFSEKVFQNIIERTAIEDWIKLSVVLAEDLVEVKYKRDRQAPILIVHASPGERAVELLRLALQTTAGPIIIDQPEDDLDNDFLAHNLVDLVHRAKLENQLIFASHSANLVVHGDTELIHVMGVEKDEDGKGVCVRVDDGTIDQINICRYIESIMEGGRLAFEKRRRKYHETIDPRRE